jgi:hypothetical protein
MLLILILRKCVDVSEASTVANLNSFTPITESVFFSGFSVNPYENTRSHFTENIFKTFLFENICANAKSRKNFYFSLKTINLFPTRNVYRVL